MSENLVHIVDEVPELVGLDRLPMVVVLDGFLDAGNAAARAAQHLVDLNDARPFGVKVVQPRAVADQHVFTFGEPRSKIDMAQRHALGAGQDFPRESDAFDVLEYRTCKAWEGSIQCELGRAYGLNDSPIAHGASISRIESPDVNYVILLVF